VFLNRQSAAKPEKESSTTIPREGSTIQAIGIGSGFAKVLRYTMDKI